MAIGFPPFYEMEIDLLGDRQAARDAVAYAFEVLGWSYETTDPDHFRAKVPDGAPIWGWKEIFTVLLEEGTITLRSSTGFWILPQSDGGQNQKNIEQFLVHYSQKELRDFKTRSGDLAYLDEVGITPLERVLSQNSRDG